MSLKSPRGLPAVTRFLLARTLMAAEQVLGRHLPAFAQEPHYTDLDVALLKSLQIQKVDHPTAFCLLTEGTFAFCPGAERFVVLRTVAFNPVVWLGGQLEFYGDDNGQTRSNAGLANCNVNRPSGDSEEDPAGDQGPLAEIRAVRPSPAEVLDHYLKDRESVKLPDLDFQDFPFHNMHLYWRPAKGSGTDEPSY